MVTNTNHQKHYLDDVEMHNVRLEERECLEKCLCDSIDRLVPG